MAKENPFASKKKAPPFSKDAIARRAKKHKGKEKDKEKDKPKGKEPFDFKKFIAEKSAKKGS